MNLSVFSHRLEDSWVCCLELQSSLCVRSWIFSEPFCLFTQVGGFLGLLLQSSILTVCEILDFIVLAVAAIWNEKKTKGQVTDLELAETDHNGFN